MDSYQFDRLTQEFSHALSRRRLGASLAALGLGAGLASSHGAAARRKQGKGKKKRKKPACDGRARRRCQREGRVCEDGKCVVVCNAGNSACRGNDVIQLCGSQGFCDCAPLVQGGFACAATRPETCPAAGECDSNAECAAGEVCVDISGNDCCGGESFGLCLTRCSGNPGN